MASQTTAAVSGKRALEQQGMKTTLPGSISGHCRWYQTITRFLPTRKRKTPSTKEFLLIGCSKKHRENHGNSLSCIAPSVLFIPKGCWILLPLVKVPIFFCRHPGVVRRREYFWVEERFPRSPEICQRSQADGICFFWKRCLSVSRKVLSLPAPLGQPYRSRWWNLAGEFVPSPPAFCPTP